jgi:hemerythrin
MSVVPAKILEWSPDYSVPVPEIDREHQNWFDIVNRLHEAMLAGRGAGHLRAIFAESTQFALDHLAHEEQLMAAAHYPALQEHVEQHDELRRRCRAFGERFDGGETTMTIEMMLYLSETIKQHIMTFDRPMGDYLRARELSLCQNES